jgi:hypothetical protein
LPSFPSRVSIAKLDVAAAAAALAWMTNATKKMQTIIVHK